MTRPTYETLLALAEAVRKDTFFTHSPAVDKALAAYEAELRPPLRTREEVDAEICVEARLYWRDLEGASIKRHDRLKELCAEPTREPEADE